MNSFAKLLILMFTPIVLNFSSVGAYPSGLDIIGPIQNSGSDVRALNYNNYEQSTITPYILNSTTPPDYNGVFHPPVSTVAPPTTLINDPSNFQLGTNADVRVYFINSNAGYHNTFGRDSNHDFVLNLGEKVIAFPNAHNFASTITPSDALSPYAGLAKGDFVDLGTLPAGSFLDFFLIANGANGDTGVIWNNAAISPDGLLHAKMVHFDGTPYYLMGWEDIIGQGDSDFNDLFVVAEVVSVPEPTFYLMLASFLGIMMIVSWRRKAVAQKV